MSGNIDLGPYNEIREMPAPKTYQIRSGRRYLKGLEDGEVSYWPEIHTIMVDEGTGHVMVNGGYGVFAYCWPHPGRGDKSLHAFLYQVGFDYFMNKASTKPYMVADIPETLAGMKRDIIEERKRGWFGRERARDLWNAIENNLHEHMMESDFVESMWNDRVLCAHYCDGSPSISMKEDQGMRNFWNEVWEPFRMKVLKPYWLEQQKTA